MNKITQHQDPSGMYFELEVPGAQMAELELGVKAVWDFFLVAEVDPWDAAELEWRQDAWRPGDPELPNRHLSGVWNNARYIAMEACCKTWPTKPAQWMLNLVAN